MKKSTLHVIAIISLFFMNFQCSDCENEVNGFLHYSATITPQSATYSIGDTLIFSSSMSSMLEFEDSEVVFDNSNESFQSSFKLFEALNGIRDAIPAIDNFDIIELSGDTSSIRDSGGFKVRLYNDCDNENCFTSTALVPKVSGYYGIALDFGQAHSDECIFIQLRAEEIISNGQNSFEIFKEINLSSIRIDGVYYNEESEIKRLYLFKVE